MVIIKTIRLTNLAIYYIIFTREKQDSKVIIQNKFINPFPSSDMFLNANLNINLRFSRMCRKAGGK